MGTLVLVLLKPTYLHLQKIETVEYNDSCCALHQTHDLEQRMERADTHCGRSSRMLPLVSSSYMNESFSDWTALNAEVRERLSGTHMHGRERHAHDAEEQPEVAVGCISAGSHDDGVRVRLTRTHRPFLLHRGPRHRRL